MLSGKMSCKLVKNHTSRKYDAFETLCTTLFCLTLRKLRYLLIYLYKHTLRTLCTLRAGFVLNLYGSESNSDNPRRSRNYAEYNVAELRVQFRIIDYSRVHR